MWLRVTEPYEPVRALEHLEQAEWARWSACRTYQELTD